MGTLNETPVWEAGVRHFEANAVLTGGPDCPDNLPLSDLANRTAWLKQQVETAQGGLAGHEAAADPHPQYATDADLAAHAAAADPHPVYLTSAEGDAKIAAAVAALVNGSPAALDTLAELATALGNDKNFATTITNALATKLTQAQGDARYALLTALAGYALKGANSDITALNAVVSGSVFRRNMLINGNMSVAQRNTSAVATGASYAPISLDRWGVYFPVSASLTLSQIAASGLAGFRYAAKMQRNAGVTNIGPAQLRYIVETNDSIPMQGKSVTLSWYAKAGANYSAGASNIQSYAYLGKGVDESNANMGAWTGVTNFSQSNTLTTAWQRFTQTFTVASDVTEIGIMFQATFAGTAGADDSVQITGVQLEEGSVATSFESRPLALELQLCKRYYEKSYPQGINLQYATQAGSWRGVAINATDFYDYGRLNFTVEKRAVPSMNAWSSLNGTALVWHDLIAGTNQGNIGINNISTKGAHLYSSNNAIITNKSFACQWAADAEL